MTKAVLTTKVSPTYDDLPEERYHFPEMYLNRVKSALGDWILYYEPRRINANLSSTGGRQAYFATARLEGIEVDPSRAKHYYGFVSNYMEFDNPVPFSDGDFYYESKLKKKDGSTNKGAFVAVRKIPDEEYDLILEAGFAYILGAQPKPRTDATKSERITSVQPGFSEAAQQEYMAETPFDVDRPVIEQLFTRPFRDRVFSAAIRLKIDQVESGDSQSC